MCGFILGQIICISKHNTKLLLASDIDLANALGTSIILEFKSIIRSEEDYLYIMVFLCPPFISMKVNYFLFSIYRRLNPLQ